MLKADWIKVSEDLQGVCPVFSKSFRVTKPVKQAVLKASARGIYHAEINGESVGNYVLAPGWTEYETRIQFQEYDITDKIEADNTLTVLLSTGWYLGRVIGINNWNYLEEHFKVFNKREQAVIAELEITYEDGSAETVATDADWQAAESGLKFCDIYDGLIYDASYKPVFDKTVTVAANNDKTVLIPQQGEKIVEQERLKPIALIKTPKGETVLDFGQNMTGYLEFTVNAKSGETADFSFGEILDKDGNFYNANYRSAKAMYKYICRDGVQTYKPTNTFYGFRYVRINEFPTKEINIDDFTAIVVHSDIKRTGYLNSSDDMLNQLFSNIIWGQKGNYLDIPTDCPQRDERLGWTGDAQVFMLTASYNYDVRRFFLKWLNDMKIAQKEDGAIPSVVPDVSRRCGGAGWSDAVTVCPWQCYLTYGDKEFLKLMFPSMKKWVNYITATTKTEGLWTGGVHFGDWLELTAEYGKCKGQTRDDIVAAAYYLYSTQIVCKTGKILGEDVSEYEELCKKILSKFKSVFKDDFKTQSEMVLALRFGLADKEEETAAKLAERIHSDGDKMQTGFLGTPYILHVLSKYGYNDLAYSLLLRKEFPSWLYPITKGATTMWEHWDGIMPNGNLWPISMNSYNHYAYGSVADWVYGVALGINTVESAPGFKEIYFAPVPTDKIDKLEAQIDTVCGKVYSGWYHKDGKVYYKIITPSPAKALIDGKNIELAPGEYTLCEGRILSELKAN